MSTLTIPNALTGETYLDGPKLEANFEAVRQYFNATTGAGLGDTNIKAAAAFGLSQLAEPRSLTYIMLPLVDFTGVLPTASIVVVHEPMEVVGVRLNIQKNDALASTYAVQWGYIGLGANIFDGQVRTLVWDDSKANNWGDERPPVGGALKVPVGYALYASTRATPSANIVMATLQLTAAVYHVRA